MKEHNERHLTQNCSSSKFLEYFHQEKLLQTAIH
uniref:Uncharacterized protein n=1 Tax=Arundo donax TaxID=35708 RepID=A0A0A9BPD3_ARUDO